MHITVKIFLICTALLLTSCSKKYYDVVYCGPNNTKPIVIHNQLTNNLPLFVETHSTKVESSIKLLDLIDLGDASVDVKGDITRLATELNNTTIRQNELLNTVLIAYTTNACNETLASKYFEIVSTIANDLPKISLLENKLKEAVTSSDIGDSDLAGIAEGLKSYAKSSDFFLK